MWEIQSLIIPFRVFDRPVPAYKAGLPSMFPLLGIRIIVMSESAQICVLSF